MVVDLTQVLRCLKVRSLAYGKAQLPITMITEIPKPAIKFIIKYNNHTQQAAVKPLESIIYSKTEYSTLT